MLISIGVALLMFVAITLLPGTGVPEGAQKT
jgi:hypothetical protein